MVAYQVTLQINTQDIGVREEICSIGAIDSDFASAESCIAVLQFLCNVYVLGEVSCVNVGGYWVVKWWDHLSNSRGVSNLLTSGDRVFLNQWSCHGVLGLIEKVTSINISREVGCSCFPYDLCDRICNVSVFYFSKLIYFFHFKQKR